MTARAFFTIGHSTRTLAEFAGLLRRAGVRRVIDVRTVPRSRTNPQFNRDGMAESLAPFHLAYEHIAELGGLRAAAAAVDVSVNAYWINKSFHNYADYALSDEFESGLARLLSMGRAQTCAVMCSEAVWWRCHRRIIADYLIARGERVVHIMGAGRLQPAAQTTGARPAAGDKLVYPADSRYDA